MAARTAFHDKISPLDPIALLMGLTLEFSEFVDRTQTKLKILKSAANAFRDFTEKIAAAAVTR